MILILVGCSSQGARKTAVNASLPEGDPVVEAVGRPEYHIGPSDLLAVTIFQVEDLNREVRVNNAGQISLPLIGGVDVAGRTVNELEEIIAERYRASYLQNPQISVFVKEFASQRITVGGAVKKPGIYPMSTSRVSLLQALALAEGMTDVSSYRNVFVFRIVNGKRMFARFDVGGIEKGKYPDPELNGEDVVIVDSSLGKQTFKTMVQLTPFVAVWRLYN
jgi:polysaccharide export outer membrane protein